MPSGNVGKRHIMRIVALPANHWASFVATTDIADNDHRMIIFAVVLPIRIDKATSTDSSYIVFYNERIGVFAHIRYSSLQHYEVVQENWTLEWEGVL